MIDHNSIYPIADRPAEVVEQPADTAPSAYSLAMLSALSMPTHIDRHVYGGTVSGAAKQARRRKNRVARASRRTNRRCAR